MPATCKHLIMRVTELPLDAYSQGNPNASFSTELAADVASVSCAQAKQNQYSLGLGKE